MSLLKAAITHLNNPRRLSHLHLRPWRRRLGRDNIMDSIREMLTRAPQVSELFCCRASRVVQKPDHLLGLAVILTRATAETRR